jgi:hypothetical protein
MNNTDKKVVKGVKYFLIVSYIFSLLISTFLILLHKDLIVIGLLIGLGSTLYHFIQWDMLKTEIKK